MADLLAVGAGIGVVTLVVAVVVGIIALGDVLRRSRGRAVCRCGHGRFDHGHYRAGLDCGRCLCVRFARDRSSATTS